jgi:hypothetical protein
MYHSSWGTSRGCSAQRCRGRGASRLAADRQGRWQPTAARQLMVGRVGEGEGKQGVRVCVCVCGGGGSHGTQRPYPAVHTPEHEETVSPDTLPNRPAGQSVQRPTPDELNLPAGQTNCSPARPPTHTPPARPATLRPHFGHERRGSTLLTHRGHIAAKGSPAGRAGRRKGGGLRKWGHNTPPPPENPTPHLPEFRRHTCAPLDSSTRTHTPHLPRSITTHQSCAVPRTTKQHDKRRGRGQSAGAQAPGAVTRTYT